MKRPYLVYLAGVVFPSVLAVAAGLVLVRDATRSLWMASDATVAHIAWEATGAAPGGGALDKVGGAAMYSLALYLDGHRATATDSVAPESLSEDQLAVIGERSAGLRAEDDEGTFVAPRGSDATSDVGNTVVFASSRRPYLSPVPLPQLLVMGLLLLFATLAGWIQLAGQATGEARRGRFSIVLLSLVPALTAWGFLVQADRLLSEHAREINRQDVSRAIAATAALGWTAEVGSLRARTGFHATLVEDGSAVATTFSEPPRAIAALPSPPSSFTSSGRVDTPEGRSAYVALRSSGSGFLVLTSPEPQGGPVAFRRGAMTVAGALAGWLVTLAMALYLLERRRAKKQP